MERSEQVNRVEVRSGSDASTVEAFEPGGELLTAMGLNPLHGARIDEIEALSCERAAELLKREGLAERLRVAA